MPSIFRTDAEPVAIASTTPLLTVPSKSSVPPLAVTVPVPDRAVFALTLPKPVSAAGLVSVMPAEIGQRPPSSAIVPCTPSAPR